jgi:NAD(P)-dependent dehydrogenase (short-subunit alcohol dehydrogenase family)
LSRACAETGWNVVMLDSDRRGLEKAYDDIVDDDLPEPALYPLDLAGAGPPEFETLLDTVSEEFGGLDALVHCAARFEGLTPLEQTPPNEWLLTVQVNLNAAWLLSVQCLPLLRESQAARLYFLLEDLAAVEGPFWGAYGVCKHALRALVSQLAAECRSTPIQVLGINPGPLRSALRSRVYHLENPGLQPDPLPLARRILDYLDGRLEPAGSFVDLQDS